MTSDGIVTNNGKKILADRGYNASPTRNAPIQFKVGDGTTAPELTDTDLEHAVPLGTTELVDDCDATTDWTDSADATLSVNSTTYKEGDGSLNWTKDGGTSTECSSYKTTTSRDFTDKELSIWLYIKDATAFAKLATTDALIIRFGSDSSNYYEWKKDAADLSSGEWNLIDGLTSANADSTTGTPTLAAMDYTYVKLTSDAAATTWSDGDFMVDDIKVISSDDYFDTFESGYPSIDYTNLEVSIQVRITTVQANGYDLSEWGVFNDDGTPLMESRDTFTALSKGSSDEFIFTSRVTIE